MKFKISTLALVAIIAGQAAAQNTFPSTGNVGIGTTTPGSVLNLVTQGSTQSNHNSQFDAFSGAVTGTGAGTAQFTCSQFNMRKARGTKAAPNAVVNGDRLSTIVTNGYDGTDYQSAAQLSFFVDGAVSSGVVPMSMVFQTGSNPATRTNRLVISSTGVVTLSNLAGASTRLVTTDVNGTLGSVDLSQTASKWTQSTGYIRPNNTTDKVMIGSSSAPNSLLHVYGSSTVTPFRVQVDGSTKLQVHEGGGVQIGGSSSTPPNNGLYVFGKIGAGTNDPKARLHVSNDNSDTDRDTLIYINQNNTGATGTKYGLYNQISAPTSGTAYAIYNQMDGPANGGTRYGIRNDINPNTAGSGTVYGYSSDISATGTGSRYGIVSTVGASASNTSSVYGFYNLTTHNGSGSCYGGYNFVSGSGGTAYGAYNSASSSGTGTVYGVRGIASGSGSAGRYGLYGSASGSSGVAGTGVTVANYGVYSSGAVYGTAYYTSSDKKLKKDIKPLENGLDKVMALKTYTYKYKRDTELEKAMNLPENEQLGFLAQELEEVLPQAVANIPVEIGRETKEETDDRTEWIKGIQPDFLLPVLVSAMQEQQAVIEKQNTTIEQLNNQVTTQAAEIAAIKAALAQSGIQLPNTQGAINTPNRTELFQNVPNPFDNTTTIPYYIADGVSSAKIIVTNAATGQVVETQTLATKGNGQVRISAAGMSAGTYTYSLVVDGQIVSSKAMVLAK